MAKLDRLENKIQERRRKRDAAQRVRAEQLRLYEKNGKKGHKELAAKKGREAIKHDKAIEKLEKLIEKERAKRPASGTGIWGGSKSILQNEVMPIAREWGIDPTSAKRWETFGNPSSDHWMGNLKAFAKDFATVNNYAFAAAIYAKLTGNSPSEWGGDYSNFYIMRAGKRFRVQIIAGTHGTGPHTHVGIARA